MKTALVVAAALCGAVPAAQAAVTVYTATLTGAAEVPPNASPATGWARVTLDDVAHTMRVEASFSDLVGTTTAAHIHCCTAVSGTGTAAVATTTPSFVGLALGSKSGSMDVTYDMTLASSYRAAFITASGGTTAGAEAALFQGIDDGLAYFNIHTNVFGGGEIRGFLQPVPEPSTYALMLLGLAAVGAAARRRR